MWHAVDVRLNPGAIQALIKRGATVNQETFKGTALTMVSSAGALDVVKNLLRNDANVNHETSMGFTALLAACAAQQVKTVNTLLTLGANPKLVTSSGGSAITLVETFPNGKVKTMLLQALKPSNFL